MIEAFGYPNVLFIDVGKGAADRRVIPHKLVVYLAPNHKFWQLIQSNS